jgi:uncharacterized repeat protein (TIGR03803 family)
MQRGFGLGEKMKDRRSNSVRKVLAALAAVSILMSVAVAATTKVIYGFAGDEDGEYTDTDLVVDSQGNIYGTSVLGGDFGTGTVFQLKPSGSGFTHTVLYSFTGGADGGQPYKGVTLDAEGNLYGTAVVGGSGGICAEDGCGVIYKLTRSGGSWSQSVIYNFTGGKDGYGPGSGVTLDGHGNLYGMTPTGGAFGAGVIYQLKHGSGGTWTLRVIHPFTGGADGASGSAGRLLLDHSGNLYGVATVGGSNGAGTAFEVSPAAGGKWNFKTLYAFKGQPDAGFPYGGLSFDKAGNLYGTSYYDGANDLGGVYKLSPGTGGNWTESVIYSFKGGKDGSSSISNVVFDKAGNLYGTTSEGGAGCSCGVIFKLAPGSNGKWTESVPYRFQGSPDAGFAYNGMVVDSAGNFYGATVHGGATNDGTIYKFTP